jgi:hypothetical protein
VEQGLEGEAASQASTLLRLLSRYFGVEALIRRGAEVFVGVANVKRAELAGDGKRLHRRSKALKGKTP